MAHPPKPPLFGPKPPQKPKAGPQGLAPVLGKGLPQGLAPAKGLPQAPALAKVLPPGPPPVQALRKIPVPGPPQGPPQAPVLAQGPVQPPVVLPAGAVLEISCARQGEKNFLRCNNGAVLYVLKGTIVVFHAGATLGGAALNFAQASWTARAGAGQAAVQRQGASFSMRFSENSRQNNANQGTTIALAFGGQNAAVSVIVFELKASPRIADDFGNPPQPAGDGRRRSYTRLGVDERVYLGFTTTPANITADQMGKIHWSIVGAREPQPDTDRATIGLIMYGADRNDGTGYFIAPFRTSQAAAMAARNAEEKSVTLKLSIQGGICKGQGTELKYSVVPPIGHMKPKSGGQVYMHSPGTPSVGFWGEVHLTPKDVSFRTLRWREGNGKVTMWGAFPAAWANLDHHETVYEAANVQQGTISGGNIDVGCKTDGQDCVRVCVGTDAYVVPKKFASDKTKVGEMDWPINWEYTYPDLPAAVPDPNAPPPAAPGWANDWIAVQKAHHSATLYQDGTMEIFKGHIGCASGECMKGPVRMKVDDLTNYWP